MLSIDDIRYLLLMFAAIKVGYKVCGPAIILKLAN